MQSKTCSKGGRPCRYTLIIAGLILLTGLAPALAADSPNIIIILVDDMGYGDLGCFGNPTVRTPSLDRMASEGQKWTSYWDIPLMRNEEILERPVDQTRLTKSYTEEAIRFIRRHKKGPFFLYLSHNRPHVPLFSSPQFRGKSLAGPYGDAVEELDWSTGQILDVLREEGLAQNTLVVFTSDNGPWTAFREHGGSSGLLRDQKGTTWEGGLRVPAIFWWPGRVRPGVVTGIGSAMDLFTTAIRLAGGEVPGDRTIDGVDLSPALFGSGASPRETPLYYRGRRVWAVRKGPFKAHFFTKPEWGHNLVEKQHDPPLLFHLDRDPSERFDISKHHPQVIAEIREILRKHQEDLVPGQDLLVKRLPPEK